MIWNWTQAFDEINTLRREMERALDRSQRYVTGSNSSSPALNIYADTEQVLVVVEAPGLEREALDISFTEGTLTLKGERQAPDLGEHVVQLRSERALNAFEKNIRIPVEIDVDKIQAQLTDGVLKIVLPKAEKAKASQISVG